MNTNDARGLLARLLHDIAPEIDLDDCDPDTPMQEAFDLDSIDFLNLVTALHEETGIDVPERDYPRLASVACFAAYVSAASEVTR